MSIRMGRVGAEMQKALTVIIGSKLKDPNIDGMIAITEVDCAKDLKTAKAFVSVMGADKHATVAALNAAKGTIRRHLSQELKDLRTVPEITFFADHALEQGNKIDSILDSLK